MAEELLSPTRRTYSLGIISWENKSWATYGDFSLLSCIDDECFDYFDTADGASKFYHYVIYYWDEQFKPPFSILDFFIAIYVCVAALIVFSRLSDRKSAGASCAHSPEVYWCAFRLYLLRLRLVFMPLRHRALEIKTTSLGKIFSQRFDAVIEEHSASFHDYKTYRWWNATCSAELSIFIIFACISAWWILPLALISCKFNVISHMLIINMPLALYVSPIWLLLSRQAFFDDGRPLICVQ